MLRYPSAIPVLKGNPQSKESRVLTNDENLKRMEEKEREREAIAKEKARKKELREQKKVDKANSKKKRVINDKSDNKADPVTGDAFSAEEMHLFRKRFDNGYDLEHDARYNEWKKSLSCRMIPWSNLAMNQHMKIGCSLKLLLKRFLIPSLNPDVH
uniref:Uncharacterized protein n=1 Tax=Amphimedon queenslandica TaxID=400682 RepID=A0A1X7UZB3_AMPQE